MDGASAAMAWGPVEVGRAWKGVELDGGRGEGAWLGIVMASTTAYSTPALGWAAQHGVKSLMVK